MKRLVCVVEGKGDVEAVPALCSRILHHLGAHDRWIVDKQAIRSPRSKLVDEGVRSPARPCKRSEVERFLALATARGPDAVLVVCDADDDCPGVWAASMPTQTQTRRPVAAVMAVREYEAWLLWSLDDATLDGARIADPERVRDAKGALSRVDPDYQPRVHQLLRTRQLDIPRVLKRSRSFNKLVRELARLAGRKPPGRVASGRR
jgi:hypothetical protein